MVEAWAFKVHAAVAKDTILVAVLVEVEFEPMAVSIFEEHLK